LENTKLRKGRESEGEGVEIGPKPLKRRPCG
jgi:hypothetical protein